MENNNLLKTKVLKNKKKMPEGFLVRILPVFAFIILLGTTIYWSILGAKVQQGNSDQLIGPYLFSSNSVFKNASFPGDHSFLIKWPLLKIIELYNYSPVSFYVITAALSALTISLLVYILYKIEKRPVVISVIMLALASILLMVPIQPVPGALLPVNMAMVTQRNIEYIIFIVSLMLIVKNRKIISWQYWLSTLLLASLIASDKLFLGLSVGGAIMGLIFYSFVRKWRLVSDFAYWFGSAFIAGAIGTLILILINHAGITGIINSSEINPYLVNGSGKNILIGTVYVVMGLLTNMGANPAASEVIIRNIPSGIMHGLFGWSFFSLVVNLCLAIIGLLIILKIFLSSAFKKKSHKNNGLVVDGYYLLSLYLIFSSFFALILFIFTNHYYAVDARYLTIFFFTVAISSTYYFRHKINIEKYCYYLLPILLVSVVFGVISFHTNYSKDLNASGANSSRDSSIIEALSNRPTTLLVGNYWRVVPIKASSKKNLNIYPVSDCSLSAPQFNDGLWQKDLKKTSFAYLLTISGSIANSPSCNVADTTALLGKPNSSILIAGTYSSPKELLLIYDRGLVSKNQRKITKNPTNTILAQDISQIGNKSCSTASSMNIVAHQDDDLLFMNPDISKEIKQGFCERTVYLTAGDAGGGKYYWLSREAGAEKAYSIMMGKPNIEWNAHTVKIADNEYVQIANPVGYPKISLIFMLLPDGNLTGQGFSGHNFQSLQELYYGSIGNINTVDGQSIYSKNDLISALLTLMNTYGPGEIRTQDVSSPADHSDHKTVGQIATDVYNIYNTSLFHGLVNLPFFYYDGYQTRSMAKNVTGQDLQTKTEAFKAYISYDLATCFNTVACLSSQSYGGYLDKQYYTKIH